MEYLDAEKANPADLKRQVVQVEEERLLQSAELRLHSDPPGSSELWQLDLRDFRSKCLGIRRASALASWNAALDERLSDVPDLEPWASLDYRDTPANMNGIWWNPFRSAFAVWPDISQEADGPLVRLADALLTREPGALNDLLDREMEVPSQNSSLRERETYRLIREAAMSAMKHLAQTDTVLAGGPDPDGLCPRGTGTPEPAVTTQ